jgi:hypothetical protein
MEGNMAADYVLFIGWNRPIPGREKAARELFREAVAFYSEQKASGHITSFEPVILSVHGGDLNGFILVKGEEAKLDALQRSDKFQDDLTTKVDLNVQGVGVIRGWSGESLASQVQQYASLV